MSNLEAWTGPTASIVKPFGFWQAVSAICGVSYFALWSFSFYPQIYLNWKRQSAVGFSPDFTYINPFGFLALTIWTWGAFFSSTARRQYQDRHDGHLPQVSASDLAFSLHAFILSLITLIQVFVYSRRSRLASKSQASGEGETAPLLQAQHRDETAAEVALTTPSLTCQVAIGFIFASSLGLGVAVWIGTVQFLDWLYYVSTLKLFISLIKYMPQILLNYRLKSTAGYSVTAVLCDCGGGVLSFLQLVVSAVFIDHQPAGIIANPAKLGLALLSLAFDIIMLSQKFFFYGKNKISLYAESDSNESS